MSFAHFSLSSLLAREQGNCRHSLLPLAITLAATALLSSTAHAGTAVWDVSSGSLPNQVTPPWTFSTSAKPTIENGYLNLTPSTRGDYVQSGPSLIQMPSLLVITGEMQLISGSVSDNSRAPAEIGFTSAANVGNTLNIGIGSIFLNTGDLVRGQSVNVDTTGFFHTYRIEVTTATGAINVFYDNSAAPVLTGSTFASAAFNGTAERVRFGGGSSLATGTSHWLSVSQNASVFDSTASAPEPTALNLLIVSGLLVTSRTVRRRRRAKSGADAPSPVRLHPSA